MSDLFHLTDTWKSLTVLVLGDVMLDCYLSGSSDRLCQEAPVPVVAVSQRQDYPGGAANTAANIASLGATALLLSVVGEDAEGDRLQHALRARGVSTDQILVSPKRTTLAKQRVLANSHLLVRFDQGDTDAIAAELEHQLIHRLVACFSNCDAVIVSDYGYGILTPRIIQTLAELQAEHPHILVADSKQLSAYQSVGVTAVKPNYGEAIRLLGLPKQIQGRAEQISPYGDRLLEITGAAIVAVTLDSEGAIVFERGRSPFQTDAQPVPANQTSGAGDTFISALTLALAAGASTKIAASVAAAATSIAVAQVGTTACSAEALQQSLENSSISVRSSSEKTPVDVPPNSPILDGFQATVGAWQCHASTKSIHPISSASNMFSSVDHPKILTDRFALKACLEQYRAADRQIVLTNGCFDILHSGHVTYLAQAKALGDILIVGVNTDDSIRQLKGNDRPVNCLSDRLTVLSALGCVDHVVPFAELTPHNLIRIIQPDVFVKGGDYTRATLPEAELVEELGGVVKILSLVDDRSTTRLIQRIQTSVALKR